MAYLSRLAWRASESVQRVKALASQKKQQQKIYPIYDWQDNDIWLYIKEHNLEFPEIYIRLYEKGISKNRLRLCSFFGDTTVAGLKDIAETEPELWEKIERRYPNAYLVLLYYDSDMFKRQTRKRTALETDDTDYKAKLYDILYLNTAKYNIPPETKKLLRDWRHLITMFGEYMTPKLLKRSCEAILAGDPKGRSRRAVMNDVCIEFCEVSRREQEERDRLISTVENVALGRARET